MKRILFLFLSFLPLLPYLATAQVAKDTVTVLTIADIPAGAIRDTTNFTFVQDNAFKKATFDSLYKYTRVKLLAAGAITSAELANALTGETGTGAAVFGTSPTISGATITTGSINNTPIGASTANTGAFTTVTASSTATATKFIPTGGAVTGNGMYLPAANTVGFSSNGVLQQTLHPGGMTIFKPTPLNTTSLYRMIEIGAQGIIYAATGSVGRFNDYTFGMGFYWDASGNFRYMATDTILTHQPAKYSLYQGQHRFENAVVGTKDSIVTFTRLMTIEESGDVGIGVNAPTEKLHVVGNARITAMNGINDIGASATGVLQAATSDYNLKNSIQDSDFGLNHILQLRPVTFLYNDQDRKIHSEIPEVGFIAQDVHDVIPNAVSPTGEGTLQLDYRAITATLTKAMQEQQAQIEALKARITQLENK